MSYVNSGKQGYTWSTIVALVLGAEGRWMTAREVADVIWGDAMTTPLSILQQVNSCLSKLIEAGYVDNDSAPADSRSSYIYTLTTKGFDQFKPQPDFNAADNTDSKLFTKPARSKSKILKFNKKRSMRRSA